MTPGFNYQEELSKCSTLEDITGLNVQIPAHLSTEFAIHADCTSFLIPELKKCRWGWTMTASKVSSFRAVGAIALY